MPDEDLCTNERKGLLQGCLPGVTLHNGNTTTYYQNSNSAYQSSPPQSHEADQLQQHILISQHINNRNIHNNNYNYNNNNNNNNNNNTNNLPTTASSSTGHPAGISLFHKGQSPLIGSLWIDNDDSDGFRFHCDHDFDDMTMFSFSIRRAAALSEARRRSEQRWFLYFKTVLVSIFLLMLWDKLQAGTGTRAHTNANANANANANMPPAISDDARSVERSPSRFRFRFDRYAHRNNNTSDPDPMPATVDDSGIAIGSGRSDDEQRQILILLKDLDEAIEGDVVLRSNKTKYRNAARGWQRRDFVVPGSDESSSSSSSSSPPDYLPPLAVVEATTPRDVQLAVPILAGLEREHGIGFRVRSGGHSCVSGYSTISDGVVLSLAKLNGIAVRGPERGADTTDARSGLDDSSRNVTGANANEAATSRSAEPGTVVMGPGVRTEEFMREVLDENGYSGIAASAAGVGMGGFVLGGGYGLQSRMYGLAIDNVASVQVVMASGEIETVGNGDDLFWGLLGAGGGNLGVVTSMEYRVYPSHDIKLAATAKVSLTEMTQFLQRLGSKESDLAPEFTLSVQGYESSENSTDLNLAKRLANEYTGQQASSDQPADEEEEQLVAISMFWMGDSNPDDPVGMEYIKKEIVPLFPNASTRDEIVYYYFSWSGMSREREQRPEYKSVWSAESWNGFLFPENNTEEVWRDIKSSLAALFRYCKFVSPRFELWGGAISEIPPNATAFRYRKAVYNIGIDLMVPTESDADVASDEMQLVDAIWPSIARHLDGAYINYPMASLSDESYPTAYWGENLDRLTELKERYDPANSFKTSQTIPAKNVLSNAHPL